MSIDAIDALLDHILLEPEEHACRAPADLDVAVDMLLDASGTGRQGRNRDCLSSGVPCHPANAA